MSDAVTGTLIALTLKLMDMGAELAIGDIKVPTLAEYKAKAEAFKKELPLPTSLEPEDQGFVDGIINQVKTYLEGKKKNE